MKIKKHPSIDGIRLTRHKPFVPEFLKDLNATQAAIRCGYSRKSARRIATRLVKNFHVEIQAEMDARASRLLITADRVLAEIAALAFANMDDYIHREPDGSAYVDLSHIDRRQASAILELTVDQVGGGAGDGVRKAVTRTRFKLGDKVKALELLGKHLKLFTDKVEHDVTDELWERLKEGRRLALEAPVETPAIDAIATASE